MLFLFQKVETDLQPKWLHYKMYIIRIKWIEIENAVEKDVQMRRKALIRRFIGLEGLVKWTFMN